jgi:hypothetical protein
MRLAFGGCGEAVETRRRSSAGGKRLSGGALNRIRTRSRSYCSVPWPSLFDCLQSPFPMFEKATPIKLDSQQSPLCCMAISRKYLPFRGAAGNGKQRPMAYGAGHILHYFVFLLLPDRITSH